ncbi:hypothetical protein F5878DRAFT_665846 [Lentinula raphanica]|uniref:Uncharacterized protein n=1 Tax=Lentinula raphanica TaxID=153919 RepID=A0AA38NYX6_9AGAR|nr:hypothetical protein F5878DRAFT_665846 [Lentinula raphanica]
MAYARARANGSWAASHMERSLNKRQFTSKGRVSIPQMATAIKSHAGLVGREYPEYKLYITSPNSRRLPEPLLGLQNVRLRANYLYGEHDPLLHPQPYDSAVPHLPLIPLPELDHILWLFPDESLFQPIDGFKLAAEPIGHLPKEMIEALEHEYMSIIRDLHASAPSSVSPATSFSSSPSTTSPSAVNDGKVKIYRSRIQYLLGHLKHEASTFSESLMAWRICQRVCLELRARITWIQSVEPRWGVHQAYRVPSLRAVIGALTDRPEIAESCLRVGIPIWLYRRMPANPEVIVEQWYTDDNPCQTTKSIVEPLASFKDADPSYSTIYSGTLGTLERYHQMAKHNEELAFPGSVFDSVLSNPNHISNQPSLPLPPEPVESTSGQLIMRKPDPLKKNSIARSKPYSKQTKPSAKQVDHGRNKFAPVTSMIMPPTISVWVKASQEVGANFRDSQPARSGVPRGYVLPDPSMLGGMNAKLYQPFLKMYLKLRPLLHYRLHKVGVISASLSNAEWRKILGLGMLKSTDGTQASKDCANLVQALQETLNGSGLDVDFTNLEAIVPEWKGNQIHADLPPQACTEILDEIIHLSFKSELLLADRFLYKLDPIPFNEESVEEGQIQDDLAASNMMDRSIKVAAIPGIITGHMGFGSPSLAARQEGIYNLYRIMRGWGFSYEIPASTRMFLERLAPGQVSVPNELDRAEYLIALHYISTYADYFKRAPVIPHAF